MSEIVMFHARNKSIIKRTNEYKISLISFNYVYIYNYKYMIQNVPSTLKIDFLAQRLITFILHFYTSCSNLLFLFFFFVAIYCFVDEIIKYVQCKNVYFMIKRSSNRTVFYIISYNIFRYSNWQFL